jgi:hypothetical protein
MAREVRTFLWCDIHLSKDEHVEGDEVTIQIGNLKPRVLAVCETCNKEHVEPLKLMLQDLGQVVQGGGALPSPTRTRASGSTPALTESTSNGKYYCQVPNCRRGMTAYKHPQSLRSHTRAEHQLALGEMAELYGRDFSQPAQQNAADPELDISGGGLVLECEHCDKGYTDNEEIARERGLKYTTRPGQSIGMHRAKVHGIPGESSK